MDKNKKSSGKKNKTAGTSQSASKGRDVTDSGNNARDKSFTPAAAAAASSIETADRLKDEAELVQLRQENRELQETKRRHEAELSALRRSEAYATSLLQKVNQSSSDTADVPLEQVLENCIRQRDELLEIKKLSERQSVMLKTLREAVTSGGCARCAFRQSYEDLETPLTTIVQCTEPPSIDPSQTRQLLLNDGRQFVLTAASANDSGVASFLSSASVTSGRMQVTANTGSRTANSAESQDDFALRDEAQAPAATAIASVPIPPCPICHRSNFATHAELSVHVNTSHLDVEDAMG